MGHDSHMVSVGFLGVGTIAEAMIVAMVDRGGWDGDILLSPRSADRTQRLAAQFTQCTRLDSNQDVIDASGIVVLGMRPQQADAALSDLHFREEHVVASLIAGTPPSGIAPLVSPASRVCQLIPLPAVALHRGPLVISPPIPEVVSSLEGLGEIVTMDDESLIRALSCASAIMSTYYEMQNRLIGWIAEQGIDTATAARYVRAELDGLAAVAMSTPDAALAGLPGEHQTRGGLNERVRQSLLDAGWFDTLVSSVDDAYRHARLRDPQGGRE